MGQSGLDRLLLVEIAGRDVIRVALRVREGTDVVGEADVTKSASPAEAAARATLQALSYAAPVGVTMSIDWFRVVDTGPGHPDIAAVLVGLKTPDEPGQQLAGAVAVRNDVTVAASRAVLDATNRRLQLLEP